MLPKDIKTVTEHSFDRFLEEGTPDVPRVILFSTKAATPALYLKMALQFHRRLVFGEGLDPDATFLARFGLEREDLPVVLVSQSHAKAPDAGGNWDRLKEELSYDSVETFLKCVRAWVGARLTRGWLILGCFSWIGTMNHLQRFLTLTHRVHGSVSVSTREASAMCSWSMGKMWRAETR
jgi:hypothetical protein